MTGNAVRDIEDWWCRELANVLARCRSASMSGIDVKISGDQCIIYRRHDSVREALESVNTGCVGERISKATGANDCNIIIESDRYLKRRLSERRLPFSRARSMASIDLADSTPLSLEDVYILFEGIPLGQGGTEYFAIKKNFLNPILESLAVANVRPLSIRVMDGDAEREVCRRSLAQISPVFSSRSRRRRLIQGAAFALGLAIIATYGHVYFRYSDAAEQLGSHVETRQAEAVSVRKAMDERRTKLARLDSARASKAQAVPLVRVLDELTSIMPDGSWITDLTVKDVDVTIVGYSPVAAELIPSIEASPLFQGTNFDAPVTRVPGQSGERFVIRTVIAR